jgi:cell pole-organizing protein PopZ
MRHTGEPTVEEILESIKKVIARDTRAGAAEQRRLRETDGMAEPEVGHADVASDADAHDDILDLAEDDEFAVSEDFAEDAEAGEAPPARETPLVNPAARASMHGSLAALAMLAEPGAPPQIVRSGETSLEGLVRDLLRPALADWLENNLPAMVERMVAAEIARIVGKKG